GTADLPDAPLLLEPGLELVFLSTRRTVSCEQASANFSSTTRSASKLRVQRCRPSGAALQASAIKRASPFSFKIGARPGRGDSSRAANRTVAKRLRVRSTVG